MGNAAGQLADRFHFLHLTDLVFSRQQFARALLDPDFQRFIQPTQFLFRDCSVQQVRCVASKNIEEAQVARGWFVRSRPMGR